MSYSSFRSLWKLILLVSGLCHAFSKNKEAWAWSKLIKKVYKLRLHLDWTNCLVPVDLRQTGIVRTIIQAEERKGVKPWLWSDHLLQFVSQSDQLYYNERSIREPFFLWTLLGAVGHRSVAIFLSVRRGCPQNFVISSSNIRWSHRCQNIEIWMRIDFEVELGLSWAKWSKWIFNNSWEEDKWVLRCELSRECSLWEKEPECEALCNEHSVKSQGDKVEKN